MRGLQARPEQLFSGSGGLDLEPAGKNNRFLLLITVFFHSATNTKGVSSLVTHRAARPKMVRKHQTFTPCASSRVKTHRMTGWKLRTLQQ